MYAFSYALLQANIWLNIRKDLLQEVCYHMQQCASKEMVMQIFRNKKRLKVDS